jgi:hypothetical protein
MRRPEKTNLEPSCGHAAGWQTQLDIWSMLIGTVCGTAAQLQKRGRAAVWRIAFVGQRLG